MLHSSHSDIFFFAHSGVHVAGHAAVEKNAGLTDSSSLGNSYYLLQNCPKKVWSSLIVKPFYPSRLEAKDEFVFESVYTATSTVNTGVHGQSKR